MLHRFKIISYVLISLFVLSSRAGEFCAIEDACKAVTQSEGLNLGGVGYPFVLETNTYGRWYYPRAHHNKNYVENAKWSTQTTQA